MTTKYKAYVDFCVEYSDKVSESYEDVFDSKEAANRWLTETIFDYRNDNHLRDYEVLDSGVIELEVDS